MYVGLPGFPLEVKENYSWEAVEISPEQNILAKSVMARYLPVAACN